MNHPAPVPDGQIGVLARTQARRGLYAYVFLSHLLLTLQNMLRTSVFRTLVTCDVPVGNLTGSSHCGNLNVVVEEAQQMDGAVQALGLVANIIVKPLVSAFADVHSRSLVIIQGQVTFALGSALMAVAALYGSGADAHILGEPRFLAPIVLPYLGQVMLGLRVQNAIINSMAAAVSDSDSLKSTWAARLVVVFATAIFGGWVVGYVVLRSNLLDYTPFMACLPVLHLLALLPLVVVVPVTERKLPSEKPTIGSSAVHRFRVWHEAVTLIRGWWRMLVRSRELQIVSCGAALCAFGFYGTTNLLISFTIAVFGWEQSDYYLLVPIAAAFGFVSYFVTNARILPRYGSHFVLIAMVPIFASGVFVIMFSPFSVYAFAASGTIISISIPFYPAYVNAMTCFFSPKEWAQAQGVIEMVVTLAQIAAYSTFPRIFDASARGAAAMTPFIVATASVLPGSFIIWCLSFKLHRRTQNAAVVSSTSPASAQ